MVKYEAIRKKNAFLWQENEGGASVNLIGEVAQGVVLHFFHTQKFSRKFEPFEGF